MIRQPRIYVTSANDLHDVVLSEVPEAFRADVAAHPRFRPGIADAWANGWRDAQWLAGCVVMGCEHADTRDPIGLMVWNLLSTADVPCPDDDGDGR